MVSIAAQHNTKVHLCARIDIFLGQFFIIALTHPSFQCSHHAYAFHPPTRFTDQQRRLSRNEPQMQTSMPRRIRTDSGYAPGSPEYNASRDLPTNYGPAPGNDGKQIEDGSSDGVASYSGGRRSASVSAHGSWWDNTGRSRDASHGTQVRDQNEVFDVLYFEF